MGRRSRKRGRAGAATSERSGGRAGGAGTSAAKPLSYAGSEARNAEVRAGLEPLAPDERPLQLKVAVGIASLLAVANLVATFTVDLPGANASTQVSNVMLALALAVAAWGMWGKRYWAVLGFQAVLALQIVVLALLLLLAVQNVLVGLGVALAILALGVMFWSLVRLMARIQLPERPGREG